ncbi:protein SON isoform X2 [Protopterus annectens]|uniref:protein SON isoform X2 n=1 Tax=Protopterus annectens TaxID=7888 RepID=UPI001CF9EF36|nr:protein SON isoform X2 [Protopterus annectens]
MEAFTKVECLLQEETIKKTEEVLEAVKRENDNPGTEASTTTNKLKFSEEYTNDEQSETPRKKAKKHKKHKRKKKSKKKKTKKTKNLPPLRSRADSSSTSVRYSDSETSSCLPSPSNTDLKDTKSLKSFMLVEDQNHVKALDSGKGILQEERCSSLQDCSAEAVDQVTCSITIKKEKSFSEVACSLQERRVSSTLVFDSTMSAVHIKEEDIDVLGNSKQKKGKLHIKNTSIMLEKTDSKDERKLKKHKKRKTKSNSAEEQNTQSNSPSDDKSTKLKCSGSSESKKKHLQQVCESLSTERRKHHKSSASSLKNHSRTETSKDSSHKHTCEPHSKADQCSLTQNTTSYSESCCANKHSHSHRKHKKRSRSKSISRCTSSREKEKYSHRLGSGDRRHRSGSTEHDRVLTRKRHRSRSADHHRSVSYGKRRAVSRSPECRHRSTSPRRGRSPDHKRASRSPHRNRSCSRSPKRLTEIEKAHLLEIAKANVAAMCANGYLPLSLHLIPVVTPVTLEEKLTVKAGGKSLQELTEKCKQIAQSKEEEEPVNKPYVSDEEDDQPFPSQSLKLNEPKLISFSLNNSTVKPAPKNQAVLTKEFPVSSGSQHRNKEVGGVYGVWIPVEKSTEKSNQPVFINPKPTEINTWAQSNSLPGQFMGSTNVPVIPTDVLLNSGPQAWLKKHQFSKAAPVCGGMGAYMMRKMGWKEGEGLGKNKEGSVEPLVIDFKVDRKGLLAVGEKTQKKAGSFVAMKDLSAEKEEEIFFAALNDDHQITVYRNPLQVAGASSSGVFRLRDERSKNFFCRTGKHPVSALMEICNKRKWSPPEFMLVNHSGPDHRKHFLFKVRLNGCEYQPKFASPNKKHAKAAAATVALQAMGLVPKDSTPASSDFTKAETEAMDLVPKDSTSALSDVTKAEMQPVGPNDSTPASSDFTKAETQALGLVPKDSTPVSVNFAIPEKEAFDLVPKNDMSASSDFSKTETQAVSLVAKDSTFASRDFIKAEIRVIGPEDSTFASNYFIKAETQAMGLDPKENAPASGKFTKAETQTVGLVPKDRTSASSDFTKSELQAIGLVPKDSTAESSDFTKAEITKIIIDGSGAILM